MTTTPEAARLAELLHTYVAAVLPGNIHARDAIRTMVNEIAALSQPDEARDAARYRWLRALTIGRRDESGAKRFALPNIEAVGDIMKGSLAQHLDAAVDAAMSKEQS